jgi:hypothetical protein
VNQGSAALLVFPLCVLLVYLVLAALYESWTLPLSGDPDRADVPALGDRRHLASQLPARLWLDLGRIR